MVLRETPNLQLHEGLAQDVVISQTSGRVTAVLTEAGDVLPCRAVVLTTGTFLRGVIHVGDRQIPAGRRKRSRAEREADGDGSDPESKTTLSAVVKQE